MANCSICGNPTQLHVNGVPTCVRCDAANTEEYSERRIQQPKESERASSGVSSIEQIMAAKDAA